MSLRFFLMVAALTLFAATLVTCGFGKKSEQDDDDDSFGGRIPTSWDANSDWSESFVLE